MAEVTFRVAYSWPASPLLSFALLPWGRACATESFELPVCSWGCGITKRKLKVPSYMLYSDLSFNSAYELRLLELTVTIQVPWKNVCLIILPCEPHHIGACLMVLSWRNWVWYSWCHQMSCINMCLIANNRNNSGWLKLLRVFLVRMLRYLPQRTPD